jgi:uncharacterized protein (TIGR03083 family)
MNWTDIVEHEGHALSIAARHDPAATVPSCPAWTVDDLIRHVGRAHHNAALIVGERRDSHPTESELAPPSGNALGWYEAGLAALLEVFDTVDPATPVWSFGADRTVGFWLRRMAHETAVHRVDAEQATGAVTPVAPELAADGIAELLEVFLPLLSRRAETTGPTGTVHVHTTDVDGEWLVTFGDTVTVTEGHAKGDAAVRGPAADLYLWLWGRRPVEGLELFGDAAMVERLRATVTV